jgi:diguanylate cyclase (GGDEF)-like protein
MPPTPGEELARDRRASDITQEDLWMRYFALGGMRRPLELDAIVHNALGTSAHDRDIVVLALNEHSRETGGEGSLPYSDEPPLALSALNALPGAGTAAQHGHRDALTGVLRRDAGWYALERAVHHAHRTDEPLMLVFVDVDHLKRLNDTQGHAAGDQLLQALGTALRQSLRAHDVVFRYGGDEFVCVLPHAGPVQATERVAAVTARLVAAVPGASVTAGYAELRRGDDLDALLRRADEHMYADRRRRRTGPPLSVARTLETDPTRARRGRLLRLFRLPRTGSKGPLGHQPKPRAMRAPEQQDEH